MDPRNDVQRLMEDMDRVIKQKQQELFELDERLETARKQLSEKEAKELAAKDAEKEGAGNGAKSAPPYNEQTMEELAIQQQAYFEQEMGQLTSEMNELETINAQLIKRSESLESECFSSRETNKSLKTKLRILSENLQEVQSANFELNMRLAYAQSEYQMQQKLLKKTHDQDQVLMDAFNDKLDSLQRAIASRDEEIKRLKMDNQFTLESLGVKLDFNDSLVHLNGDGDGSNAPMAVTSKGGLLIDSRNKQRVIEVASALKEKDAQIELLKGQLLQATKDLENNATLLETLSMDKNKQEQATGNKLDPLEDCNLLTEKCRMLESELEHKDGQLHLIATRNNYYESILPNKIIDLIEQSVSYKDDQLSSLPMRELAISLVENLKRLSNDLNASQQLLDKIEQLKGENKSKELQIEQLVRDLNQLDAKLNSVQHQYESSNFRVTFQSTKLPNSSDELHAETESESERHKVKQRQQEAQVKSKKSVSFGNLKNAPDSDNQQKDQQKDVFGPSDDQKESSELVATSNCKSQANQERKEEQVVGTSAIVQRTYEMGEKAERVGEFIVGQFDKTKSMIGAFRDKRRTFSDSHRHGPMIAKATKIAANIERPIEVQNRLRQLESENQLLELAMKEILLSIKWSDTKCSTVLIDCPSLERLCQLIEARFLANSMDIASKNGARDASLCSSNEQHSLQSSGAGDVFQFVVLKSELDLLRGQNEQLRGDLKLQRREYRELLSANTKAAMNTPDLEQSSREKYNSTGVSSDDNNRSKSVREAQCQTCAESATSINEETTTPNEPIATTKADSCTPDVGGSVKCDNCTRLIRLSNHLMQCIVWIESRVSFGDEIHMNRLEALYKLTQKLASDLSNRERTLNQLRRDKHLLTQQKLLAEYRLHAAKSEINVHAKICPLASDSFNLSVNFKEADKNGANNASSSNFQVIASSVNGQNQSSIATTHSLTMLSGDHKKSEVPMRDSNMAIALLQSIIGCLQARLDFKDERLQQLEAQLEFQ